MISNNKPVLLSGEQMKEIRKIQQKQSVNSALGVSPSVNSIARALVAKGLEALQQEQNKGAK